ncbi:MAG TPA: hypothetical protein HPP94_13610 [Desulfuromonadales bacterium]|nr:hypothetical protein [Desulfuromonadales bacterium]
MISSAIELESGLRLTLCDESSHYFGGYFHVRITARCPVPLLRDYFESDSEFESARRLLGAEVCFIRSLEKMAVPESEVAAVRCQLIDDFNRTARRYLDLSAFAKGIVLKEFRACSVSSRKYKNGRF